MNISFCVTLKLNYWYVLHVKYIFYPCIICNLQTLSKGSGHSQMSLDHTLRTNDFECFNIDNF